MARGGKHVHGYRLTDPLLSPRPSPFPHLENGRTASSWLLEAYRCSSITVGMRCRAPKGRWINALGPGTASLTPPRDGTRAPCSEQPMPTQVSSACSPNKPRGSSSHPTCAALTRNWWARPLPRVPISLIDGDAKMRSRQLAMSSSAYSSQAALCCLAFWHPACHHRSREGQRLMRLVSARYSRLAIVDPRAILPALRPRDDPR